MSTNIRTRPMMRREQPKEQPDGGPLTIEGYFVVFNQPYDDGWGTVEYVDPHAFDNCDMSDVRALVDHDTSRVLGRSCDHVNTLQIEIDDVGLYGIIQVNPEDQDAMNCRARTLRGDVDQASFGFEEYETDWTDNADGTRKKVIKGIRKLWEISVCTFPAYEATAVAARNKNSPNRAERESARYRDYLKRRLNNGKK